MENKRPFVSFCIVTYNQEKYVLDTLRSAVGQTYGNIEIVISDDSSRDNTCSVIQKFIDEYDGPHKIIFHRNDTNVGPRENINKVLYELSQGDIIMLFAGDDVALPTWTEECVALMEAHPQITSMSVSSLLVDEELNSLGEYTGGDALATNSYSIYTLDDYVMFKDWLLFSGDSRVLRRKVVDMFPPLQYSYSEDLFMFIRSFYVGSVAFLRKPLTLYRQHTTSIMWKSRKEENYATKDDVIRFENESKKQILADFQYAYDHKYFSEEQRPAVAGKIYNILKLTKPNLRPRISPHSLLYRGVKSVVLHLERFALRK